MGRLEFLYTDSVTDIDHDVAVPLLIQGLDKDQNDLVRAECATALGELGSVGKGALPQLKALLGDESEIVRQAAADAVKKLDK